MIIPPQVETSSSCVFIPPEILKKIELVGNDPMSLSTEWNHQVVSPHLRFADVEIVV
jgi:predicted Zn-dependent protease